MDKPVELRQLLEGEGDDARRVEKVLDWLLESLPAEGAALLTVDDTGSEILGVRCARGSLVGAAPLLAVEFSRAGAPVTQGPIGLAADGKPDTYLCCPIAFPSGRLRSALVLHGPAIDERIRDRGDDMPIVCSLIEKELQKERMRGQRDLDMLMGGILEEGAPTSSSMPGLTFLADELVSRCTRAIRGVGSNTPARGF